MLCGTLPKSNANSENSRSMLLLLYFELDCVAGIPVSKLQLETFSCASTSNSVEGQHVAVLVLLLVLLVVVCAGSARTPL